MHSYIYIVEIFPGKFIISCMHRKIFHYMKNFLDENFPSILLTACSQLLQLTANCSFCICSPAAS